MNIYVVERSLVCTRRVGGLKHQSLRVLRDAFTGDTAVATDPIGARPGNRVFAVGGSAARYAMDDWKIYTDLSICGIIDRSDEDNT